MVEKLSAEQVVNEIYSQVENVEAGRELGHGLSSKDALRFRTCMDRARAEKLLTGEEAARIYARYSPHWITGQGIVARLWNAGISLEKAAKMFAP